MIPTYRRTAALSDLLSELRRQAASFDNRVEIIVVDNCPDRSARSVVAKLDADIRYISEPRAGVANARNTGVQAANGEFVVFIDDDQLPCSEWLASFETAALAGYSATFGPVLPAFETVPSRYLEGELEKLFSRNISKESGADISTMRAYLGTGNSMFAREALPGPEPFDPRFGVGEDVWLLRDLVQKLGYQLTWCREAVVTECVPQSRMNITYIRQRRFRNGQLRCLVEFGGRNFLATAFWMAVGSAQTLSYSVPSLLLYPFDRSRSELLSAKAAAGLGKVLWWLPVRG